MVNSVTFRNGTFFNSRRFQEEWQPLKIKTVSTASSKTTSLYAVWHYAINTQTSWAMGALQRGPGGPWPTQTFCWAGHNAFGPTNNWPVCSL